MSDWNNKQGLWQGACDRKAYCRKGNMGRFFRDM